MTENNDSNVNSINNTSKNSVSNIDISNNQNLNNQNLNNQIDRCENIRSQLKENQVDPNKYDLCYTKSLSIQNDSVCNLCRYDKNSKQFICRPNVADEEILSEKDFCKPLSKYNKEQLNNIYYPNVIDICKKIKSKYKNKNIIYK